MLRENRDEFLSSYSQSYSLLSSKLSWVERVKIPTVGLGIIRYELFHLNNQSSRSLEKFPTFQKSTRQSSNGIILFFSLVFLFREKVAGRRGGMEAEDERRSGHDRAGNKRKSRVAGSEGDEKERVAGRRIGEWKCGGMRCIIMKSRY